ncbi:MAG: hypothetical protein SRB2_03931 [Desulfobacteraceae bacterium Eth-SRB2]|nr:MAG: hypothetical protein SRB2_03931 [Desulfobacteraceae bacterium Eth-SRB2]
MIISISPQNQARQAGDRTGKNADACMKMPRDIRGRNPHIVRGQTRYIEFRSPDTGKSPAGHKDDKSHTAAQTGLRKPARTFQNGPIISFLSESTLANPFSGVPFLSIVV